MNQLILLHRETGRRVSSREPARQRRSASASGQLAEVGVEIAERRRLILLERSARGDEAARRLEVV